MKKILDEETILNCEDKEKILSVISILPFRQLKKTAKAISIISRGK